MSAGGVSSARTAGSLLTALKAYEGNACLRGPYLVALILTMQESKVAGFEGFASCMDAVWLEGESAEVCVESGREPKELMDVEAQLMKTDLNSQKVIESVRVIFQGLKKDLHKHNLFDRVPENHSQVQEVLDAWDKASTAARADDLMAKIEAYEGDVCLWGPCLAVLILTMQEDKLKDYEKFDTCLDAVWLEKESAENCVKMGRNPSELMALEAYLSKIDQKDLMLWVEGASLKNKARLSKIFERPGLAHQNYT